VKRLALFVLAAFLVVPFPSPVAAQATSSHDLKEWAVEWGGRTRDPYVAPDGKVWFVGQQGNYIAHFDPATEQFRRYEIEEGTNPHNLIVDESGFVWYTGNQNGRIGKLDPNTGEAQIFMMPDPNVRDPHTLTFDGRGNIWFTAQGANRIGRLQMETGNIELIVPNEQPSNPYGIVMHDGDPWVALFRTNTIVRVDSESLELTRFEEASPNSRSRRLDVTEDGIIWYLDQPRGFLGKIDPATGDVTEWQAPGGANSSPYAITKDDQGRLWFSETGPVKQLVGFDPATEEFFSVSPVSGTIRHMMFDERTGAMWFGTDANQIGRILVRRPITD
jgi:virginiamycin B lyase